MIFRPAYNAIFEVDEPILPGTTTTLHQWFGDDAKLTLERLLILFALNKYINQGIFNGPGKYLLHMHRRHGWRVFGHIYKFPIDADLMKIAIFLATIGIDTEGDGNVTTYDPRNN